MIFPKAKNGSLPNWLTEFAKQLIDPILPYQQRRKIRFIISALTSLFLSFDQKTHTILHQKNDKKILFIFGITTYSYRHQRSQHLAEGMAKKGYLVLYIEPEFLPLSGRSQRYSLKRISNSIYTVRLASPKNYFIYSDYPSEFEKDELKLSFLQLRSDIHQDVVIAKIDHPFWQCIIQNTFVRTLYDCMDEHSAFPETSKLILKAEKKLIQAADRVIASSNTLFNKTKRLGRKDVVLLSNGVEISHFSKVTEKIPPEFRNLPQPIIGYYGAIESWLDIRLIEKLIKTYSTFSFVFIGKINNKELMNLSNKHKNLFLLGEKSYNILPAYVHQFKIAIIPFKLTALIQATNPVKFYEYAAAKKTIITTALPELRKFKNNCFYCIDHEKFVKAVDVALKKPRIFVQNRMTFFKQHSWDYKTDLLQKVILSLSE